jgi:hypothetical protein
MPMSTEMVRSKLPVEWGVTFDRPIQMRLNIRNRVELAKYHITIIYYFVWLYMRK